MYSISYHILFSETSFKYRENGDKGLLSLRNVQCAIRNSRKSTEKGVQSLLNVVRFASSPFTFGIDLHTPDSGCLKFMAKFRALRNWRLPFSQTISHNTQKQFIQTFWFLSQASNLLQLHPKFSSLLYSAQPVPLARQGSDYVQNVEDQNTSIRGNHSKTELQILIVLNHRRAVILIPHY